jgi:hypothetical protein
MSDDALNVFKNSYNNLTNSKNGRLSPRRDSIIRDDNFTELSKIALKHDQPDFISGKKTYNAIVIKTYPNPTPIVGTTLEGVLSNIGDYNTDNFIQVRAVIPDVHSSIIPLPKDLSPESLSKDGEIQKYINLAPTFYSIGDLNGSVSEGAIIEVEFTDNDYNEGRIVSIVKSTSIFEAAQQAAKKAFEAAQNGINNLFGTNNTTGDGSQTDNLSNAPDGKCGDGSSYSYQDCKTAALESTGQTITLHPDFWDSINELLNNIKNTEGLSIKIGESIRNQSQQLSIRKSRCPQWQGCISEDQLKSANWTDVVSQCRCSDATPVAAVTGPYASNHLKGLAVDFKMDISPCPASNVNKSSYDNCRRNSKVFNALQKYANPSKVKNYSVEPWHWSYNGK